MVEGGRFIGVLECEGKWPLAIFLIIPLKILSLLDSIVVSHLVSFSLLFYIATNENETLVISTSTGMEYC